LKKYYKQKNIVNALLVQNGENADYGYEDMMKARQKMLLNADDIDDGVDDEIEMDIDPDLESDLSDDSDIVQVPEMDSPQIACQDDEDDVKSDLRKLGIVW
jgi:hypothetical protein